MRITGGTVYVGKYDAIEGVAVHFDHCAVIVENAETKEALFARLGEQMPAGSSFTSCHFFTPDAWASQQATAIINGAKRC